MIVYVICTGEEVAERLASRIHAGTLPVSHISERACLLWWGLYPTPLKVNHLPYAVTLSAGGEIEATRRLAAPELCS
jgi:hypothetical protein